MSRMLAIRQGDKTAFRALIEEHGKALAMLVADVAPSRSADEVVLAVWQASYAVNPKMDERAFVIGAAIACLTPAPEVSTHDELDLPAMYEALARQLAGHAYRLDDHLVSELKRHDPRGFDTMQPRLQRALRAESGPWTAALTQWERIEPTLR